MPSFTFVPRRPRKRCIMSARGIFTPALVVSFTVMMRSPASMPTFSDGPLDTGWIMSSVSSTMLNCTPMPSNEPSSGSFKAFVSLAVVYVECGSSDFNIPCMPSSTNFCWSTVSTYSCEMAISAIWSLRRGSVFWAKRVQAANSKTIIRLVLFIYCICLLQVFAKPAKPTCYSTTFSSGKSSSTTRLSMMKFWRSMVFFPI